MMKRSISVKKTEHNSLISAKNRAIEVRRKASDHNATSSYEFGGWKSLLETIIEPAKFNPQQSQSDARESKSNFQKNNQRNQKNYENTLCPSSQPDQADAIVFGVVEGTFESPKVGYLEQSQTLADIPLSSVVKPQEMLRIASTCIENGCQHFDGTNCRLATKVVEQLPVVTETLPACQIRSSCRWWQQEGKSACWRCPQVVTDNYYTSPLEERVADPKIYTLDN